MYFYRAKNQTEIKENMVNLILETNILIRRLIKMDFIRSSLGITRRKRRRRPHVMILDFSEKVFIYGFYPCLSK